MSVFQWVEKNSYTLVESENEELPAKGWESKGNEMVHPDGHKLKILPQNEQPDSADLIRCDRKRRSSNN